MEFKFSNIQILDELQNIENKYYNISDKMINTEIEIQNLENDIENEKKQLEELTCKFDKINQNLNDNAEKLSILNNELPHLQNEFTHLKKELDNKKKCVYNAKLKEFQQYILNLDLKDCLIKKLYNDTSTVKLLDEYCSSKKDFLILKNQFWLKNNRTYVSLIITASNNYIDAEKTQPTMTELKQNSGKIVHLINCNRLNPLLKEIELIDKENKSLAEGSIFAFNCPYLIGGQTSLNRTGYGCEWIGGGDYIEGTLYGEVTDFMVVGILIGSYLSW